MNRLVEGGITGDELEIGKSYYLKNSDGLTIDLGELRERYKSYIPYMESYSLTNNRFVFEKMQIGRNEFIKKYNTNIPTEESWYNLKIFYPSPSGGKRKKKKKRLMSKKVKKNRRKLTRRIKFE